MWSSRAPLGAKQSIRHSVTGLPQWASPPRNDTFLPIQGSQYLCVPCGLARVIINRHRIEWIPARAALGRNDGEAEKKPSCRNRATGAVSGIHGYAKSIADVIGSHSRSMLSPNPVGADFVRDFLFLFALLALILPPHRGKGRCVLFFNARSFAHCLYNRTSSASDQGGLTTAINTRSVSPVFSIHWLAPAGM